MTKQRVFCFLIHRWWTRSIPVGVDYTCARCGELWNRL